MRSALLYLALSATCLLSSRSAPALTIEEAVTRAITADPAVATSAARLRNAAIEVERSKAWLPSNPFLSTTISSSTFGQSSASEQPGTPLPENGKAGTAYTFFLEQEVEIAGQRSSRIAAAAHSQRVAELNHVQAQREAAATARNAFLNALTQRELVAIERDALHWEKEALRTLQDDYGDAASGRERVELSNAEVRVWKARRTRGSADRTYQAALAELARLLHQPAGESLELQGQLPDKFDDLPPEAGLAATAQQHRADLLARQAYTEWAVEELNLAKKNQIPTLNLSAFVSTESGEQQYGGGIGIPLPVFHSTNLEVRSAAVDYDRAQADFAGMRDRVAAEVRAAYDSCRSSEEDVTVLRDEILPRLRQIAAQRDKLFDKGQSTAAELIDAEMDVLDARRDYVLALGTRAMADVDLARAVGAPVDTIKAEISATAGK